MATETIAEISVVVFRRGKWWIAQCLQHDIGAQARSPNDAVYELQRSVVGHLIICDRHGKQPFAELPAAPQAYWKKFEGATMMITSIEAPLSVPVPVRPPRQDIRLAA
ncbi:MAG: hypothetical protein KF822_06105 [Steroidobacteraceae bacterium]|nr:hypothetical protein [Steroidobacteraceae bacterium]